MAFSHNLKVAAVALPGVDGLDLVDVSDAWGDGTYLVPLTPGEAKSDIDFGSRDIAPPTVTLRRSRPTAERTDRDEVTFLLDFKEDVVNVDASDFAPRPEGSVTTGAWSVGDGGDTDGSTYTVTVSGIAGDGILDLGFAGTEDIRDITRLLGQYFRYALP